MFVIAFFMLGYLGTEPSSVWGQAGAWLGGADRATVTARICTVVYFLFFLLMPWYTRWDRTRVHRRRASPEGPRENDVLL